MVCSSGAWSARCSGFADRGGGTALVSPPCAVPLLRVRMRQHTASQTAWLSQESTFCFGVFRDDRQSDQSLSKRIRPFLAEAI
jgi:hypothetical protein